MASPFSVFRRQEKRLLAVLAIMAMFAFTFVGFAGMSVQALLELVGGGMAGPASDVIARTNWGEITRSELADQQQQRAVANRFVAAVQYAAGNFPQSDFFGQPTQEDVVNALLIRRHAGELGMRISNQAVERFIDSVARDPRTGDAGLSTDEFRGICTSMGIPDVTLFDILRDELMVSQMAQIVGGSFLGGVAVMTPAELWENYQKLNTRISLEVAAVPVADFVAQVPAPSEAELQSYFEQHKRKLPDPSSPEPGFKQPQRIQVEYLMANFDRFLEGTKVSEEEIQRYYEDNKEKYRILDELPEVGTEPDAGAPSEEEPADAPAEKPAAPAGDVGQPDSPAQEPAQQPAGESSQAAPQKPSQPADVPKSTADDVANQDSVEQQTDTQPAEPPRPAVNEEPMADNPAPPEPSEPAEPVPSRAEEPTGTEGESQSPGAGEATQASPADPKAEAETARPAGQNDEAAPASKVETGTAAPADEKPQPRYRPLDNELALEIRDELRRAKARQRIEQVLDTVSYNKIEDYASRLVDWQAQREEHERDPSQPLPQKPEPPDLKSIAGEYGLEYGLTPLVSRDEAAELEGIGLAFEFRATTGQQGRSFVEEAFSERPLYEALLARDEHSNGYLYWKVEEVAEHVPTFDEARDQALASWQLQQAREHAEARAAELAKKAREAQGPLAQALAADPSVVVQATPPFTWLTIPPQLGTMALAANPPEPSEVVFVEQAGDDFFQTAFALSEGEVGTAANSPQKVWYVMRVATRDEATRDGFLRENFFGHAIGGFPLPSSYDYLAARDRERIMQNWLADLQRQAGLEWVVDPDTPNEDAFAQR